MPVEVDEGVGDGVVVSAKAATGEIATASPMEPASSEVRIFLFMVVLLSRRRGLVIPWLNGETQLCENCVNTLSASCG